MSKSKILSLMILLVGPWTGLRGAQKSATPDTRNRFAAEKENPGTSKGNAVGTRPAPADPNYVIGPEDELIVNVWRELDLSRTVPVRPDGKISLPLLNDVQASGMTPMQLGEEITTRLKKFISDPQVTIIVNHVNSQRIFVVGEVNHAGAFSLLPNMRVLEGISSAGGCTPFARQSKVYVLRLEDGHEVRHAFNFKEVLGGKRMEQNILLKAGDTIVVP